MPGIMVMVQHTLPLDSEHVQRLPADGAQAVLLPQKLVPVRRHLGPLQLNCHASSAPSGIGQSRSSLPRHSGHSRACGTEPP